MVPVRLSVRNFLSYGEAGCVLDFSGFHVACLTGDNGHGKSALLDAITYALWGEARKGRSDRKPDEGLLRIGASDMHVEFTFDLDAGRYRVIRQYRRRPRSSATELDLQIYDEAASRFRSLSAGHLTSTQSSIIELLSMDYDTFINSAFIVQGRADEFTRKSASERKQVLSEILGLSRYERLGELARSRLRKGLQRRDADRQQLASVDSELAQQKTHESRLLDLGQGQTLLDEEVLAREARLVRQQAQRKLVIESRDRLDQLAVDLAAEEEGARQLEARRAVLEQRRLSDDETLSSSEEIEADFRAFEQHTSSEKALDAKATELRELESRRSSIEDVVREARHVLAQRRSGLESERRSLEKQRQQSQSVLRRAATIESDFAELGEARRLGESLDAKRARFETTSRRRDELRAHLELERSRLEARLEAISDQRAGLDSRLRNRVSTERHFDRIQKRLGEVGEQVSELERLKTQVANSRAALEQIHSRLVELEQARETLGEKRRSVGDSQRGGACPLCGSELDEAHVLELHIRLTHDEEEQQRRIVEERRASTETQARLADLLARHRELERSPASLEKLQQSAAEVRARVTRLEEEKSSLRELEHQLLELGRALRDEDFSHSERMQLGETEEELARNDFRAEDLLQAREKVRRLSSAEGQSALLLEARTRDEQTATQLATVREKIEAVQDIERREYAGPEQRELDAIASAQLDLQYDREHHRWVKGQLDGLRHAPERHAYLAAARLRRRDDSEALEQLQKSSVALEARRAKLRAEQQTLENHVGRGSATEAELSQLRGELAQWRAKRDELLQKLGSVQARLDRCEELTPVREELRRQVEANEREGWIYGRLSEAFGMDGIQALLIEGAIPEIEEEANSILSRLTDNRVQIAMECLRDLKKGGTKETLDIRIADEVGERSYHLYSGGETFRTDFALRIALSKVLARRAGTRLRTLIIDEGFGTQDSQGLEHLKEAIQVISRDFDKLLIVTHLQELKDAFPVQIEVSKHPEAGSQLKILGVSEELAARGV